MKKRILFFICIILKSYLFCEGFCDYVSKLEGAWLSGSRLSWYDLNNIPEIHKNKYKEIYDATAVFVEDSIFTIPMFSIESWHPNVIDSIKIININCIEISYFECEYEYIEESKTYLPVITNKKNKLRVNFLSKDEIHILDCGFDDKIWYKIDGPSLCNDKKANCNDNRVRLRLKPDLNSQTLAFFNKDDCFIIKDRSAEKYEIDNESWYWYKVDNPNYPDGWIYGKYMDFISDEEYENLLAKQEEKAETSLKQEKKRLTKLEILENMTKVFSQIKINSKNSKDNDSVYNDLKGIYKYNGNILTGKKNLEAKIINNKIYITDEIKIGMSEKELKDYFGSPDEVNCNIIIYREKYGKFCEYISSFYIEKGTVEKIILKREMLY